MGVEEKLVTVAGTPLGERIGNGEWCQVTWAHLFNKCSVNTNCVARHCLLDNGDTVTGKADKAFLSRSLYSA